MSFFSSFVLTPDEVLRQKAPKTSRPSRYIPEGWHTRRQAAKLIGKSSDTIRRWHREGIYEPLGQMPAGQLTVWLYSDEDITNMKKVAATSVQGIAFVVNQ